MYLLIIALIFNSSYYMGIGSRADDLAGILDNVVDIVFMELFGTPADRFSVNY